MATRIVASKSKVVAYLPNIRAAVRHFRAFSSYDEHHQAPTIVFPEADQSGLTQCKKNTVWPDEKLGPLGPKDQRFPMPGFVGPSSSVAKASVDAKPKEIPDILSDVLAPERHILVLQQAADMAEEELSGFEAEVVPSVRDALECVAMECPQILRKDFQDLFPEKNLMRGNVTVMTMSQKTKNDMSGWNPEVEEERETLLGHFIAGAEDICIELNKAGYWADFVDPSSGRPYLGPYTNATLFETDERYRNFGFEIEDLGCCKVISHHLWGRNAYVGCLFTNAPIDHPILQNLTQKQAEED